MKQALEGITVVVTRAASQADELSTLLESYGAKVIVCPTIEIRELENYDRLDEALDHLYGYDWLILTSTNGVDYFLKRLTARGQQIADLDEIKVCTGYKLDGRLCESLPAVSQDLRRAEPVYATLPGWRSQLPQRVPMGSVVKVHALYDSLMDVRRQAGEDVIPFHRFAAL